MRRWFAGRSSRQRQLLAVGLGAVSALALPPFNLVPVLLLAIPGLLMLLDLRRGGRGAFADGFWFGFGHHAVGLYWITEPILFEVARFWWLVPIAVPILASALGVYVGLTCALARVVAPAGWRRALALAGFWVLADLLRGIMFTGFPWNPIGSVWAVPGPVGDVMLQPLAWIGAPGLTFVTLLLAAAPVFRRVGRIAAAATLTAWIGFGLVRIGPLTAPPNVAVALLQGNISQAEKHDRRFALDAFRTYIDLSRSAAAKARARFPGQPIVVVWPESASPFQLDGDPGARAAVIDAAGPGVTTLAGSVRFDQADRPYNSLVALAGPRTADGPPPPLAIYDKWHLVPFGEYQPAWARVGIQLVQGEGFARGPGPRTMHLPGLPPVGPLICYEVIFPGHVVDPAERPRWLVNVTNDAWFGDWSGPRQHLAAVRMRAVEEGLPIMRAANTGISAGYDPFGRELGRIDMNRAGSLVLALPPDLPPTPFARLGLLVPLLMAISAIVLSLSSSRINRVLSTINDLVDNLRLRRYIAVKPARDWL